MGIRLNSSGLWLGRKGSGQAKKLPLGKLALPVLLLIATLFSVTASYATRDSNLLPILAVDGPARGPVLQLVQDDLLALGRGLLEAEAPPLNKELETFRLMVDDNAVPELLKAERNRKERGLGRSYYPALLWSDQGGWQRSKVTVRGASSWHHTPEKPSLRVKVARADQAGRRFWELSRPEDPLALCNWLPERLGEQMGLMTARSETVRLLLNGKFLGLYLTNYRLGEPLALANLRLPGTFFNGENINGQVDLWSDPKLWSTAGEEDPEASRRFESWLTLIRQWRTSPENIEQLFQNLDRESFAAWCAMMVFSSSYHSDDFHNQTFFYNTYRGHFEPVVWDVNGFGPLMEADSDPDLIINLVQNAAYSDPRFFHRRNEYLWRLLQGAQDNLDLAQAQIARIEPDLQADTSLGGVGPLWPDAPKSFPFHISGQLVYRQSSPSALPKHLQEFQDYFRERVESLESYFQQAHYRVERTETGGSQVRVYGRVAVEVRSKTRPLVYSQLHYSPGNSTLLYPGHRSGELDSELLRPIAVLRPAALVYGFDNPPEDLQFFHAHSGQALSPSESPVPKQRGSHTIHPAYFFPKPSQTITLGPGEVELKQDLIVAKPDRLEIAPGTNLRLGPGVQLVCFGEAALEGQPNAPISVQPLQEGQAWGSVSFVGQESLTLRHWQVEGGSVSRHQGYAFKGMLNAYQVKQVSMSHCSFARNRVGDDAVNMANSGVEVSNCSFQSARADALDLDRCTGSVSHCQFLQPGNDGLDLSHAELQVSHCLFEQCGDKGVSVGENSQVTLQNLNLEQCAIGIQCKDQSLARLSDSLLKECGIGLSAYRKKKIFSRGGTILYRNLTAEQNKQNLDIQARSVIANPGDPGTELR